MTPEERAEKIWWRALSRMDFESAIKDMIAAEICAAVEENHTFLHSELKRLRAERDAAKAEAFEEAAKIAGEGSCSSIPWCEHEPCQLMENIAERIRSRAREAVSEEIHYPKSVEVRPHKRKAEEEQP